MGYTTFVCFVVRGRFFFFYIDIIRSNYVDRVTIKYPVRVCFVKDGRRVMLINFLRKSMICDSISSKLFEIIYLNLLVISKILKLRFEDCHLSNIKIKLLNCLK